MFNQFDKIRGKWSELFTVMGRRFTPESLKQFEQCYLSTLTMY